MTMIALRECKTGQEVVANIRRTHANIRALKPWEAPPVPAPVQASIPAAAPAKLIQRPLEPVADREFGWWPPRIIQVVGPEGPLQPPRVQMFFEHPVTRIAKVVCRYYGITLLDIRSERRTRNVVRPRQIAMYLARTLTRYSLPEISRRFGDRDHTTGIAAVRRIELLRASDAKIDADVAALTGILAEG